LAILLALFAEGCGLSNALVGGTCAAGYVQCGDQCIAVASDQNNCGACGNVCAAGSACIEGTCEGADGDASGDAGVPDDAQGSGDAAGDAGGNADVVVDVVVGGETGGDDGSANDGGTGDGGTGDGGTGDGGTGDGSGDDSSGDASADAPPPLVCVQGLTVCGAQCVDLSNDALNCGACANACGSEICENSQCVGSVTGGIVFIGHDYQSTDPYTAQARVLSNAVFMPHANPLRALSFEEYASPSAVSHVSIILQDVAQQLGRTLTLSSTVDETAVTTALAAGAVDVLVVHDQPNAAPGALAALGSSWAASLAAFTLAGGVVVVLDGGTGTDEMPNWVTATGLLSVQSDEALATGTELDVVSTTDVVGIGVLSPYAAESNSVTVETEPNGGTVVWVVNVPNPESSPSPVVVHKAL
jgi:hypothetical protein